MLFPQQIQEEKRDEGSFLFYFFTTSLLLKTQRGICPDWGIRSAECGDILSMIYFFM